MNILIVGPFPPPIDGCSNSNKVLYKNITARNIRCDFINTNTKIISGSQGMTFSLRKSFLFIKNYAKFFKILTSEIIYVTPGQTFYGVLKYAPFMIICLILNKPYVIHVHGNYLGVHYKSLVGLKMKIFHFLISRAAAGLVITKSLSKNFEGLLDQKKVFIVDYFVEDELYKNCIIKKVDKLRILYMSNLMREKGILEFLDGLLNLKLSNVNFTATIAGVIEPGLESEIYNRLKLLKDNVTYIGVIQGQEKIDTLSDSNVFILPTYYPMEGLPFSILEAMATGNILITTNHGGITDVILNSNGFIVNKRSSSDISECLKIINLDIKGMIMKFSEFNRKYSSLNFTEKNFTDQILTILHATAKPKAI